MAVEKGRGRRTRNGNKGAKNGGGVGAPIEPIVPVGPPGPGPAPVGPSPGPVVGPAPYPLPGPVPSPMPSPVPSPMPSPFVGPMPGPMPSPAPMPWTPPQEGSDIMNVIRFGWHFAQLRGLYDPRVYRDPDPPFVFDDNAMRLTDEWTRTGKADEAEEVVVAMATALMADVPLRRLDLTDMDLPRLGVDPDAPAPPSLDTNTSAALAALRARLLGIAPPSPPLSPTPSPTPNPAPGPTPTPVAATTRFCGNCGASNPVAATHCGQCGAYLAPLPSPPPSPPPSPMGPLRAAPGFASGGTVNIGAWQDFTWFLRTWDEHNQQSLIARSPRLAAGYRLGRALSEIRWGLHDHAANEEAASWNFLLGPDRRQRLDRLVNRVSPYLDPLTPACLSASLTMWQKVAKDPDWRDSAGPWLSRQAHLWHDLITNERTPKSLIQSDPLAVFRRPNRLWPVVSQFRFEIVISIACLIGIGIASWLALQPQQPAAHGPGVQTHWYDYIVGPGRDPISALIAIGGFFGLGVTTLAARMRNNVHGLVDRLKLAFDASLVNEAAVVIPPMPWPPPDDNGCITPASVGLRAIAFLIDLLLASVFAVGLDILFIIVVSTLLPQQADAIFRSNLDIWAVLLIVPSLYFLISWQRFGNTVGMAPFQMNVVNAKDGGRPSLPRLLIRLAVIGFTLVMLVGAVLLGSLLGLVLAVMVMAVLALSIAFDKRRRGLHDWISGTWVVRTLREVPTKPRPAPPPQSVLARLKGMNR